MQRGRGVNSSAVAAQASAITETEPANWKPLEKRIGRRCAEFMWMFRQNGLEYYKHLETRRYLILDQKGRCYSRHDGELIRTGFRQHFRIITRAMPDVN